MKDDKYSLRGTGKVFRFTLTQMFKNRANLLSLAILLVMGLLAAPLMNLVSGSGFSYEPSLREILLCNETPYPLSPDGTPCVECEPGTVPDDTQLYIHLYEDETGVHMDSARSAGSKISDSELEQALSALEQALTAVRLAALGDTAQLALLTAPRNVSVETAEALRESDSLADGGHFAIQYVYAIGVMMLCLMAASYIIRAVVEERASKLVELLVISVRPLALIAGKILAVMTYVFGMMVMIVASTLVSYRIFSPDAGLDAQFGFSLSDLRLGWQSVLVIFVSLALSYLTFSILAGISGSCCSTMEDMESAYSSVLLLIMGGYILSCMTGAAASPAVSVVTSLIPILSAFCAPAAYLCGDIGIGVLLISWLIQLAVLVGLALLCARVYHELVLYKGGRVKWKALLAMAKEG